MMKKVNYSNFFIISFLSFWATLFLIRVYDIKEVHNISHISAQAEILVHILMLYVVFRIYQNNNDTDKKVLKWLVIAAVGLFLNDLAFYLVVYKPNNYLINLSANNFIFDMIPFGIWVFAIISFLSKILINNILGLRRFIKILSFFIVINFIVIFLCLSSIKYALGAFSWESCLQILSYLAESIIFDFSILCLIYSENKGLSLILSGLIILISGDFLIDYLYLSQTNVFEGFGELLWFLGLLIILFGMLTIDRKKQYHIKQWLRVVNTIKSKLAFSALVISIINILPIFVLAYFFFPISKDVFLVLPLFIMMYSIVVVVLSRAIGEHFEIPFKQIANNIKVLMLDGDKKEIDHKFSIEEFIFLQNFIVDAFRFKEEKEHVQRQLSIEKEQAQQRLEKVTAQVAHDIRSPLSALQVFIKRLPEIGEEKQILLRDAVNHIRDIANNLEKDASPHKNQEETATTQTAVLLDYVLSEQRVASSNNAIQIVESFSVRSYSLFINVIPSTMRRILTNIINNAREAISSGEGVIEVKLDCIDNEVNITISDTGPGISKEVMASLFTRGFTTKKGGSGLGLYYARESLAEWGGSIELDSCPGDGTKVTIQLPAQEPPCWFVNELAFNKNDTVICVDDNISIWHGWQERFRAIKDEVDLRYCNSKESLQGELQKMENSSCTFLVDYEFSGKSYTGLALIDNILSIKNIKSRIFLVTSRSSEEKIQTFCREKAIQIIPKFFVSKIPLRILTEDEQRRTDKGPWFASGVLDV